MNKYIDADKLKAEIERRKEKWLAASRLIKKGKDKAMYAAGKSSAYTEFFSLITSLQQEQPEPFSCSYENGSELKPEVDLEKEIDKVIADYSFTKTTDSGGFKTTVIDYAKIARHFYELGLNARKKETK